jgi:Uma2 family endonuclease
VRVVSDAAMATAQAHFSRAQWDELVVRGLLRDLRLELLRGRIVEMTPPGPEHSLMVTALNRLLADAGHVPDVEQPLAATEDSAPQPDISLGGERTREHHPFTAALVAEVAVSRQADAWDKASIYAEAGVDTCLVVDVPARTVHVLEQPGDGRYRSHRALTGDDVLHLAAAGGLELTVAELFARAGF